MPLAIVVIASYHRARNERIAIADILLSRRNYQGLAP